MDIFSFPFYNFVLNAKMPLSKALPASLDTFGDHIRNARLQRGLEQGQVARMLGVTESTVWNWEDGRSSPPVHACREVISFLGYDPFPVDEGDGGRLAAFRRRKGLRVKDAAARAGVDPGTWSGWERGRGANTAKLKRAVAIVSEDG